MIKYWPIYLACLLGILFSNILFSSYHEEKVMTSDGNVYLLQYGAYTDKSVLDDIVKKISDDTLILQEDNIYYIYFGVTTNYNKAQVIKKKYNSKGIYLYIKNSYVGDSKLVKEIKENDDNFKTENYDEISLSLGKSLKIYEKYQNTL